MGRYNNRRTQAQAEAMKNTPSRARFSKGPPNKNNKNKRKNNNNNSNSSNNSNNNNNNKASQRVIDKIQNRVQQQQQQTSSSGSNSQKIATTEQAIKHIDKTKLDELKLSIDVLENITKLLENLGVKEKSGSGIINKNNKTTTTTTSNNQEQTTSNNNNNQRQPTTTHHDDDYNNGIDDDNFIDETCQDDDSINNNNNFDDDNSNIFWRQEHIGKNENKNNDDNPMITSSQTYQEYDDDYDEYYNYGGSAAALKGIVDVDTDDTLGFGDDDDNDDDETEEEEEEENFDDVQDVPAFVHLTQQLSFPPTQAARACRALGTWNVLQQQQEEEEAEDGKKQEEESASSTTIKNKNKKIKDESIGLAVDWLCLHLTEEELAKGFRQNPNPPSSKSKSATAAAARTIKAIPHPSISIAKSITSDKEWMKAIKVQQRIVSFVKWGFHHSEASQACEEFPLRDESSSVPKPIDDPALPRTVQLLEQQSAINNNSSDGGQTYDDDLDTNTLSSQPLNSTDLEYVKEEREQEREALVAIYDDQFKFLPPAPPDGIEAATQQQSMDRYMIQISPAGDIQPPARSDECQLFVFLRPGYPVVESPSFLFTNPKFPPALLRRINEECSKKARENIGAPVVFEVVTFLSEEIADLQLEFIKEQRRMEFEAKQLQMRAKAGHAVNDAIEAQYDSTNGGKLGRRQRAKLKSAEKAYDRAEQLQKLDDEWRKRQDERMVRVKEENNRVRDSMAQRAIQKREQERIEQEAEQSARLAMNDAFNRGESPEEARAAAEVARVKSLQANGVESPEISRDGTKNTEEQEEDGGGASSSEVPVPTAKTAAFMDRLSQTQNTQNNESSLPGATPTTVAFMDRLRQLYDDAVEQKAAKATGKDIETTQTSKKGKGDIEAYHLEAKEGVPDDLHHQPRPVAVPTGELEEVMTDIIAQQKDQPWLISTEARAPTVDFVTCDVSLSTEQQKRRQDISKKLRAELLRKRKQANDWAVQTSERESAKSNNGAAFSPKKFHDMMSTRQRLPAFQMEREIVETIHSNQITVVAGDTGCGKTTQIPQLVLDDLILRGNGAATNIIVTQPRRISAIGVSERIAAERCEQVGETCGYSIKLEKKMSKRTRLLLCTTGILLRRLQCDPDLASVSHIFVDEVHERDLNTDFLIIILKDLLARRKELKLVLMSATLNSEAFSSYFGNCPVVSIPGRAHPVEENRLEDVLELTGYQVQEGSDYALQTNGSKPPKISKSALRKLYYPKYSKETIHSLSIVDETVINYELLAELLEHISLNQGEGAILVFMPGMMEIQKAIEEMYKKEYFQSSKVVIYPLHSSLSTAQQTAIFEVPPEGVRKIVVSTNIAETSITIEDVVFVVDSGRVKENRRDEINETPTLIECWVSRASAKQRRGRAGRVRPGIAYHLFSGHTHDNDIDDYQLPEMLRVGIEDLVLQILILDLGEPTGFLSKALNPPSDLAMSNSLKLLETLGAVECRWQQSSALSEKRNEKEEETLSNSCGELKVTSELTALGFHLATLPVDPRVGKMVIYGSLFGCVDPALTVAASMSARSPFVSPFDQRDAADAARKKFAVDASDHLSILNAFQKWKELRKTKGNRVVQNFVKENFLGRLTLFQMEDLRKQYADLLSSIGFLPKGFRLTDLNAPENANSHNVGLIKAVLCAGLYPNIIIAPRSLVGNSGGKSTKQMAGEVSFQSHRKGECYLHPSTIAFEEGMLETRYCCYHEMVKTSKTYVRDCTSVSPFALLLFGGDLKLYQAYGICSIDDWLKFRIDSKPATLVKYLRGQMERILLRKIVSPHEDVFGSEEGKALIRSISMLFEREAQKEEQVSSNVVPDRSGGEGVRPWTGPEGSETNNNRGNNQRGGRGGRGRGRGGRGRGRGRGRGGARGRGPPQR